MHRGRAVRDALCTASRRSSLIWEHDSGAVRLTVAPIKLHRPHAAAFHEPMRTSVRIQWRDAAMLPLDIVSRGSHWGKLAHHEAQLARIGIPSL